MFTRQKVILFISIIFILNFYIYSQSGLLMSVSGFVKNLNTQEPIPNSKIDIFRIENQEVTGIFSSKTDINGFYKIKYLETGTYQFSINLPEIGDISINMIGSSSDIADDYYGLDIRDGKNIKLNIFYGENPFPYIEKEKSPDEKKINITILYPREIEQEQITLSLKSESDQTDSSGLIFHHTLTWIVPDDWILRDKEGNVVDGLFVWIEPLVNYQYTCENGKCVFHNLSGEVHQHILMHSDEWWKNKYPDKPEQFAICAKGCMQQHESWHDTYFKKIVNEEWNSFFSRISNISADCECKNESDYYKKECPLEFTKQRKKMVNNVKKRIRDTEIMADLIGGACLLNCNQY